MKQRYWQTLPWAFCGLGICLISFSRARAWAKHLLKLWHESIKDAAANHRLTLQWCSGRMLDELRAFAEGAPLEATPRLRQLTTTLALIPLSERPVEALHALVNSQCVNRRVSFANISLVVRLQELMALLESQHDVMIRYFDEFCHVAKLAQAFGYVHHPGWVTAVAAQNAGEERINWDKLLDSIFYGHSAIDWYERHAAASRARDEWRKLREQQVRRLKKVIGVTATGRSGIDQIRVVAARDHLRRSLVPTSMYRLPTESRCIEGLDRCFNPPGAAVMAPAAATDATASMNDRPQLEADVSVSLMQAIEQGTGVTGHVFLKVVDTTPAKGRHIRAGLAASGGGHLHAGDIGVAAYKAWLVDGKYRIGLVPQVPCGLWCVAQTRFCDSDLS